MFANNSMFSTISVSTEPKMVYRQQSTTVVRLVAEKYFTNSISIKSDITGYFFIFTFKFKLLKWVVYFSLFSLCSTLFFSLLAVLHIFVTLTRSVHMKPSSQNLFSFRWFHSVFYNNFFSFHLVIYRKALKTKLIFAACFSLLRHEQHQLLEVFFFLKI